MVSMLRLCVSLSLSLFLGFLVSCCYFLNGFYIFIVFFLQKKGIRVLLFRLFLLKGRGRRTLLYRFSAVVDIVFVAVVVIVFVFVGGGGGGVSPRAAAARRRRRRRR